jgi:hypothetical protein
MYLRVKGGKGFWCCAESGYKAIRAFSKNKTKKKKTQKYHTVGAIPKSYQTRKKRQF